VAPDVSGNAIASSSRLVTLAPEFDETTQLIRVGGRLRHSTLLDQDAMHPIMLDPQHWITKLIIKDFDEKLFHLAQSEYSLRFARNIGSSVAEKLSDVISGPRPDAPPQASLLLHWCGLFRPL